MADNNITFKIGSQFSGEGFKQAQDAIRENRKEIAGSVRGLGELTDALGKVSPSVATAVSAVKQLGAAFVAGGIVGGTIQLAITGISFAVEKGVAWFQAMEERAKKLAEAFRDDLLKSLGDSEARFKSLTNAMAKADRQAKDLADVLNGNVAKEAQNKVFQLNMEKLKAVTEEMSEGSKAVVEAQFAMREAAVKAQAAIETSYNNLEAANAQVENASKVLAEAEKRAAQADVELESVRLDLRVSSEDLKKIQDANAEAHKAVEDASYALEKAQRNAASASDKVSEAEANLDVAIRQHEKKIKDATKKIDEEMIRKNELALKEEEASRKFKEWLEGAFDREMNARNELAKKEEDAKLALQDYIDGLKEKAGMTMDEDKWEKGLEELSDILAGKVKTSSGASANASVTIPDPLGVVVRETPTEQPILSLRESQAQARETARAQRDLQSELNAKFGSEIPNFLNALSETHRTKQQQELVDHYKNDVIPKMAEKFGSDFTAKYFQGQANKVLMRNDLQEVFGNNGTFKSWIEQKFSKLGLK